MITENILKDIDEETALLENEDDKNLWEEEEEENGYEDDDFDFDFEDTKPFFYQPTKKFHYLKNIDDKTKLTSEDFPCYEYIEVGSWLVRYKEDPKLFSENYSYFDWAWKIFSEYPEEKAKKHVHKILERLLPLKNKEIYEIFDDDYKLEGKKSTKQALAYVFLKSDPIFNALVKQNYRDWINTTVSYDEFYDTVEDIVNQFEFKLSERQIKKLVDNLLYILSGTGLITKHDKKFSSFKVNKITLTAKVKKAILSEPDNETYIEVLEGEF